MQNTTMQKEAGVVDQVPEGVADLRGSKDERTFNPGNAPNPYLAKGLSPIERESIRRIGTQQQKAWLRELTDSETTDAEREYAKKLNSPAVEFELNPDREFERINASMLNSIMGKREQRKDPAEIYPIARLLLYNAYCAIVYQRTSERPQIKLGDQISNALALTAHWLVDAEEWMGEGEKLECWDIRKSLYFCGEPGNGKSSVAMAAAEASRRLYHNYKTRKMLTYRSMNQVVTDIMAEGNLKPLKDLSTGGLVLDELRLEHLTHKYYGNDLDILADTLLHRWEIWNYKSQQTIITTNITPKTLADNLQDDKDRVKSRLRDQFVLVKFTGPSFREAKMKEYALS